MIALSPPIEVVYNESYFNKQFEKTLTKSLYNLIQKGSDLEYKIKINSKKQEQYDTLRASFDNGINSLDNTGDKKLVSNLIASFLPFFLEMNPSIISLEFTHSKTLFLYTVCDKYNIYFEVYINAGEPNYTVSIYKNKKLLLSDYGGLIKILSEISATINYHPINYKSKKHYDLPDRNFATAWI